MAAGNRCIFGVMVESHIHGGAQKFTPGQDDPAKLAYGHSITDACIAWDDSVGLLDGLARAVKAIESGAFAGEITPVTLPDGTVVSQDDGIRAGTGEHREIVARGPEEPRRQPRRLRLRTRLARRRQADTDVHAAVLQIEGMGMSLGTEADHGGGFSLEELQIGIFVSVDFGRHGVWCCLFV